MSSPHLPVPGQLSPDGAWRWDGHRWVPTGTEVQTAPPARHARRGWIWWVAGGCAVLLVLGVGLGIFAAFQLAQRFKEGSLSCLPSDFPRYSGTTTTRDYTYFGTNVAPGDSRECQESLTSQDDVAAVTAFYESQLSSGDWTITSNDASNGAIRFARHSRPQTVGIVQLLGRGQHTVIEIRLDS
jgi:hypothetical protein